MPAAELMREAGYKRRWVAADATACTDSRCPGCGAVGLRYTGWTKTGSYRAFARCVTCGREDEF